MSALLLIRHGQASFGAEDYDVLSPLGGQQASALGAHLAERELRLDALYCGPARRHRGTANHLRDASSRAGRLVPEAIVMDELDEYPAIELMRRYLPVLRGRDREVAAAMERLERAPSEADSRLVYGRLSQSWASGELDCGDLESFEGFRRRVEGALHRIRQDQGRGKTVAVVTSGGPIAISVQLVLDLSPSRALDLAWVVANASITELRYRDDELGLIGFNHRDHLRGHLLSFR